jgi:hypothetical protein
MIVKPELLRAMFHAEALSRLKRMEENGAGIPAAEVFDYLCKRVRGKPAVRPELRKIA